MPFSLSALAENAGTEASVKTETPATNIGADMAATKSFIADALAASEKKFAQEQSAKKNAQASEQNTSKESVDGLIYIHTVRKSFSRKNVFHFWQATPKRFDINTSVNSKDFSFECKSGELATFVFSNKLSMCVRGPAKFSIKHFKMPIEDLENAYSDNSKLEIIADGGAYYFYSPDASIMSPFVVETKYGNFEIKSGKAELNFLRQPPQLVLLDGNTNITLKGYQREFVGKNQIAKIISTPAKGLSLERTSLIISDEDAANKYINQAKLVYKMLYFYADKNGKIAAKKAIVRDFILDRKN